MYYDFFIIPSFLLFVYLYAYFGIKLFSFKRIINGIDVDSVNINDLIEFIERDPRFTVRNQGERDILITKTNSFFQLGYWISIMKEDNTYVFYYKSRNLFELAKQFRIDEFNKIIENYRNNLNQN